MPVRIAGYVYRAEMLCPSCTVKKLRDGIAGYGPFEWDRADVEAVLDSVATANGIDRYDESTYDSDEFPKVVFGFQTDGDTCDGCGEGI